MAHFIVYVLAILKYTSTLNNFENNKLANRIVLTDSRERYIVQQVINSEELI